MKRKKLPGYIRNPLLIEIFQTRIGRIFTNWVLQGMLYMNIVEIVYKLLLDVVFMLILFSLLSYETTVYNFFVVFFVAHTLNWILNCQPIALLMHIDIGSNNAGNFISYIEHLDARIKTKKYLAACAAYGSLSIGGYKPTSDIDIRVIMKPDMWSKVRAANFCFIERFRAFLSGFPLDLYAFTLDEVKYKMSPKEPPILFYDPEGILNQTYDELVMFNDFRDHFRDMVLPEYTK